MSFIIKKLYYKLYMSEYYQKNRELIIEYNITYYYTHKKKVRERQKFYFKNIYYPNKIKPKKKIRPIRQVVIEQNVTVKF